MSDYHGDEFDSRGPGYYRVYYGSPGSLEGPFNSIGDMAQETELYDYPDDGYIVHFDGVELGSVPSLNPDDLLVDKPDPEMTWIEATIWDNDYMTHRYYGCSDEVAAKYADEALAASRASVVGYST